MGGIVFTNGAALAKINEAQPVGLDGRATLELAKHASVELPKLLQLLLTLTGTHEVRGKYRDLLAYNVVASGFPKRDQMLGDFIPRNRIAGGIENDIYLRALSAKFSLSVAGQRFGQPIGNLGIKRPARCFARADELRVQIREKPHLQLDRFCRHESIVQSGRRHCH